MWTRLVFLFSKAIRRLRPAALRRCQIDPKSRVLAGSDLSDVVMKRYSYCGFGCEITDCDIGAFSSIAGNVVIGGAAHPMGFVSTSPVFCSGRNPVGKNFADIPFVAHKRTSIGNDVWIGNGAKIRSGVTIGDGAVIGMGSVVTRDVAPYAVVAGTPAREIRKRFAPDIIARLQASRWWDLSDTELEDIGYLFDSPEAFLAKVEKT